MIGFWEYVDKESHKNWQNKYLFQDLHAAPKSNITFMLDLPHGAKLIDSSEDGGSRLLLMPNGEYIAQEYHWDGWRIYPKHLFWMLPEGWYEAITKTRPYKIWSGDEKKYLMATYNLKADDVELMRELKSILSMDKVEDVDMMMLADFLHEKDYEDESEIVKRHLSVDEEPDHKNFITQLMRNSGINI